MTKPILPHVPQDLQSALEIAPKHYPLPRRAPVRSHGQYRALTHFHQSPKTTAQKFCLLQRNRWDSGKTCGDTEAARILAGIQYELWHQALMLENAP